jgi:phage terminase Nu1 subunit (DNA packaging protein)
VATSDEELERHCTPGKLKRYIALHLEKEIAHEEDKTRLHEELSEARAATLSYKEAFEEAHAAKETAVAEALHQQEFAAMLAEANECEKELARVANVELAVAHREIEDQVRCWRPLLLCDVVR